MIRAILFDFDGVITKDDDDKEQMLRMFRRETGLSDEQVMDVIRKHIGADLYYGRKGFTECWNDLCDELKVSRALVKEYIDDTPVDKRILELASRLRDDYQVCIVTTNGSERMRMISEHFGLDQIFHHIFVSADLGVTKREKGMFEEIIKKLGVEPGEMLFIDNSPGNLVEPKKLGIRTFMYTYSEESYEELMEELKNNGIPTE